MSVRIVTSIKAGESDRSLPESVRALGYRIATVYATARGARIGVVLSPSIFSSSRGVLLDGVLVSKVLWLTGVGCVVSIQLREARQFEWGHSSAGRAHDWQS